MVVRLAVRGILAVVGVVVVVIVAIPGVAAADQNTAVLAHAVEDPEPHDSAETSAKAGIRLGGLVQVQVASATMARLLRRARRTRKHPARHGRTENTGEIQHEEN